MPTQGMGVFGCPECGGPQLRLQGVILGTWGTWGTWGRMGWGRSWSPQHGTIPCRTTAVGRDVISAHISPLPP